MRYGGKDLVLRRQLDPWLQLQLVVSGQQLDLLQNQPDDGVLVLCL